MSVVAGRVEGMYGFFALAEDLKNKGKDHKDFKAVCNSGDKVATDIGECLKKTVYYEIGGSSA